MRKKRKKSLRAELSEEFGDLGRIFSAFWRGVKSVFVFLGAVGRWVKKAYLKFEGGFTVERVVNVILGSIAALILMVYLGGLGRTGSSSSSSSRIETHEDYINASDSERIDRVRESVGDANAHEVKKGLDSVYGLD